jgi:hypothetical protein
MALLLGLLLLSAAPATGWSAPPALLARAYADKLDTSESYTVSGLVHMDSFKPLARSQLEVVLRVAGVQRRVTWPLPNSSFAFHRVPPGTHALDVVATGFEMATVRVDVSSYHGRVRFSYAASPDKPLRTPLVLFPHQLALYAEPVQGFGLRYLLQNPMYLGLGFMAVFAFALPKIMANMDPEEMKIMQDQLAKGGMKGLLSGALNGPPEEEVKKLKGARASAAPPAAKKVTAVD